jgi:hypothetical protein
MDRSKAEKRANGNCTVVGGAGHILAIYPPSSNPGNYLNTLNLETNLWRHEAGRLPAAILKRIFLDIRRGVVIAHIIVRLSHCVKNLPCAWRM